MSRIKRIEYFDGQTHHTVDIGKETEIAEELPDNVGVVLKKKDTGIVKMKIINMPVVIHYEEDEE